jgi:DNA polymerase-3 subunit beta
MTSTVRFKREELSRALKQGEWLSDGAESMAASCVRIAIAKGVATLVWTNLSAWLTRDVPADCDTITACAIPAGILARSCSGMDGDELRIELNGSTAKVASGRSRITVSLVGVDGFPLPPKVSTDQLEADVGATALCDALESINYFTPDDIGSSIAAVNFRCENGDVFVATYAGVRLAIDNVVNRGGEGFEFNLPLKSAAILARLCKECSGECVEFRADDKLASFRVGPWMLVSALRPTGFLNYAPLVEERSDFPIMFDPREVAKACSRLSVAADKYSKLVRLDLTLDCLTMTLVNPKIGEAVEEIPVAYEGEPRALGFNVEYLREALRHVPGDDAAMHIGSPVARAMISPRQQDGAIHIIGPMAI